MASFEKRVVWTEGMMLLPQHFQQQTRFVESQIRKQIAFSRPHHWGFHHLVVDQALLKTGKFRLQSASGIFPDGSYFDIPGTDDAPPAIDIDESLLQQKVYLSVPLVELGQTEVSRNTGKENLVRLKLAEVELTDVTEASALKSPIEVAGLQLSLLTDKDERGAFACIPLALVIDISRSREVTLDPEFLPPAISFSFSGHIQGFITELTHLLSHRTQALASRVSIAGKASTFEVQDFLMLQLLNRYLTQARYLSIAAHLSPEELYLFMTGLLAEMSVFIKSNKLYLDQPNYEHENLSAVFKTLIEQLRQAFSVVLEQNAVQIQLTEKKYGVRVGVVADKTMFNSCGFVLAVNADITPEEIRQYLPPQVKIGSVEQIKELVNLQLPGIAINTLAVAPREIPYKRNCVYFELVPKGQYWQSLSQSGGVALHIGANIPGLVIELWAIRNGEK